MIEQYRGHGPTLYYWVSGVHMCLVAICVILRSISVEPLNAQRRAVPSETEAAVATRIVIICVFRRTQHRTRAVCIRLQTSVVINQIEGNGIIPGAIGTCVDGQT